MSYWVRILLIYWGFFCFFLFDQHALTLNIAPGFTLKLVDSFFSTLPLYTEVCFLYVDRMTLEMGPEISLTNLNAYDTNLAISPTVISGFGSTILLGING